MANILSTQVIFGRFAKSIRMIRDEHYQKKVMTESDNEVSAALEVISDELELLTATFQAGGWLRNAKLIKIGFDLILNLRKLDAKEWIFEINSPYTYQTGLIVKETVFCLLKNNAAPLRFLEELQQGILDSEITPRLEAIHSLLEMRLAHYQKREAQSPRLKNLKKNKRISSAQFSLTPSMRRLVNLEIYNLAETALIFLLSFPSWGEVIVLIENLQSIQELVLKRPEDAIEVLQSNLGLRQPEWMRLLERLERKCNDLLFQISYVFYCLINFKWDDLEKIRDFKWSVCQLQRHCFFNSSMMHQVRLEVENKQEIESSEDLKIPVI